jgi:hypothetical protein
MELTPQGLNEFAFDVDIVVPADASGECHFEMQAADALGNSMETGFHVEVE